jgi:hypothetical protein
VNEDWMTELEVRAGEELERKMERYARLRLAPSAAQAKRARSAVMEAAWRERLGAPVNPRDTEAIAPVAVARRRSGPFAAWGPRRFGVSFAAAVLAGLLVGTTAFATSRAGGPLYAARVAFEELTLPTDPLARLEAELALAQVRLGEITDSVARHDPGAVSASVQAYLSALDGLDESTGGPADRALTAVAYHLTVLNDLLSRVPDSARSGLENAIARSGAVIERLDEAGMTPTTNGGNGNGGTGGANGGGNGTGAAGADGTGANPNAGGGPNGNPADPTAKPSKDPRPTRTAAPVGTERPTRTPNPRSSDVPGQEGTGGRP